jgi:hypothetical protein
VGSEVSDVLVEELDGLGNTVVQFDLGLDRVGFQVYEPTGGDVLR